MNTTDRYAFRTTASFMLIAGILQVIGLLRHVERLPGDWVGIGIYIVCIIAFIVAAYGFYTRVRK